MPGKYPIRKYPHEQELFLHEIERLNDPQARILDLGAGEGTFNYAAYQARIISVDKDIPADFKPSAGRNAFLQADGAALPFSAQVFDVVVANFVFEHFIRPDLALRETQRVLKAGGLLYLSIPNSDSLEDRIFRLLGGAKHHVHTYSFHSLIKLVYQSTNLKLIAFADWPAGFTWLNTAPSGNIIRRGLWRCLRLARRHLQAYSIRDSGFIFLFRSEDKLGFRLISHVCSYCGAGATIETSDQAQWECMQCNQVNLVN
jgi:SAM-dependent methyltransferase